MAKEILFPEIAAELKAMRDEDQAARAASMTSGDWSSVETIDKRNTTRMKEIIAEIGWPTIPKVGDEGSTQAWLLVQHADLEPAFQEACLDLMKKYESEDIDIVNIAYLEDRLLSAAGKPQIYGTQFVRKGKEGMYEPYPISELDKVDERRASLGLEPMEAYHKHINKRYLPTDPEASDTSSR